MKQELEIVWLFWMDKNKSNFIQFYLIIEDGVISRMI